MKTFFSSLMKFISRIKVLQRPDQVTPGSLILFPFHPNRRHCGLAGILEVVQKKNSLSLAPIPPALEILLKTALPEIYQISEEDRKAWKESLETLNRITEEARGLHPFGEIFSSPEKRKILQETAEKLVDYLAGAEQKLYGNPSNTLDSATREKINSLMVILKDLSWRLNREILSNLSKVENLFHPKFSDSPKALFELRKLNSILNNLDRLEIRGRDSAGFSTLIYFSSEEELEEFLKEIKEKALGEEWERRCSQRDFGHKHIHRSPRATTLCFAFKVANEIGKLGDNMAFLRREVAGDEIFQRALSREGNSTTTLSHTRWASNGIINIPNCHPVDNMMAIKDGGKFLYQIPSFSPPHPLYGERVGYLNVVLNGDIDNFVTLRESLAQDKGYFISPNITTDVKIIPLQVQKYLEEGKDLKEAFQLAVSDFKGSSAIALQSDLEPGKIYLSLKGSGQSIYIGLGQDNYCFASEIYGLVEETSLYIKMDGEKLADEGDPESSGQIFILNRESPGDLAGIEGLFHNGTPVSLEVKDLKRAEITTRDIDRKGFDHFFLKEISESPRSVLKTFRGKFHLQDGKVNFKIGEEILPSPLVEKLTSGKIRKVWVIGQGTAGIAAMAIGAFLNDDLKNTQIAIQSLSASELSGFHLSDSMEDTLILAVTQSGTTTDTNNAVELARRRGASTLAIVNRRNSDITYKVDGVFYTSNGRDVEMSVASTKAFYSQVVAGNLLSLKLAQLLKTMTDEQITQEIRDLEGLPDLMKLVLQEKREEIARSAAQHAPTRKYWAVVGSGHNHIAAREVRIKLSELCYKSIACDYVEDKKHIDLSSEPLIIICAAGSNRSVLGDIIKDVSIFKAHKSLPIVFTSEGKESFYQYASHVVELPQSSGKNSLILNTLAGHLWGYYAALAIHQEGMFISKIRSLVVEDISRENSDLSSGLTFETMQKLEDFSAEFHRRKREERFQGAMKTETGIDLSLLFKYATNKLPLVDFRREFGKIPTAKNVIEALLQSLSKAFDEMVRPIDAIKHQAKTVTVGTSRLELPQGPLFDIARELKIGLEELELENLNHLKRVQPAIEGVKGYTLYKIDNLSEKGRTTEETRIYILSKGGIAKDLKSRVETPSPLQGNKKLVAQSRRILLTVGKSDGREILLLPLLGKNFQIENLLLFHISFKEELDLKHKAAILSPNFLEKVKNTVVEANLPWKDEYFEGISPRTLLTEPAEIVAEKIIVRGEE